MDGIGVLVSKQSVKYKRWQPGKTGATWERPSGSGMPRGQPFFRCQRGPWRKWRFDAPRSRQYGIPCSWSDQPWAKPPGTVTEAMIPGFTMRVRVTNRKALLAWFAGQPGETGNHGAAKGWRAAFHMCGGCTGGSIPSCPTRALRFSMLPTAWEPPRTTGQRKTVRIQRSYEVSTATFRSERRNGKPYDPVGTVNIARWQSGSERRLTARTDGCAAG